MVATTIESDELYMHPGYSGRGLENGASKLPPEPNGQYFVEDQSNSLVYPAYETDVPAWPNYQYTEPVIENDPIKGIVDAERQLSHARKDFDDKVYGAVYKGQIITPEEINKDHLAVLEAFDNYAHVVGLNEEAKSDRLEILQHSLNEGLQKAMAYLVTPELDSPANVQLYDWQQDEAQVPLSTPQHSTVLVAEPKVLKVEDRNEVDESIPKNRLFLLGATAVAAISNYRYRQKLKREEQLETNNGRQRHLAVILGVGAAAVAGGVLAYYLTKHGLHLSSKHSNSSRVVPSAPHPKAPPTTLPHISPPRKAPPSVPKPPISPIPPHPELPPAALNQWSWSLAHQLHPGHETEYISKSMQQYTFQTGVPAEFVGQGTHTMIQVGNHIVNPAEMHRINEILSSLA